MDLDLSGKTAIVTGSSKGIGRAVAAALLAEGAHVTLVARNADLLEETAAALSRGSPGRVRTQVADLSRQDGRVALSNAVETPDILINNAGAVRAGRLCDLGTDAIREDWDLKVFGYIHLCELFKPRMAARGAGVILNVIGMAGRANTPAYISGSAANAALIAFTQALGAESQADGIRVLGLNPSPTLTDRMQDFMVRKAQSELGDATRWREMVQPERFAFGRPAEPEEVGALAAVMVSAKASYVNGTVIDMDGGSRWMAR